MSEDLSLNGKSLVLTGAGGFLGRNLIPLLLDEGTRVVAVTSRERGELCELAGIDSACDVLVVVGQDNRRGISDALDGTDFLINAGFPRSNDGQQLARGMDFIDWLFREAATRGTKAVVNISSQSVYDQHRCKPATEEAPVCPQSPYAVAKYATELMLNGSCQDIPHTSIRLASLIGPGFDQRVPNKMMANALLGKNLTVTDRTSRFGYLDVIDAADAITALLRLDSSEWYEEYNVGSSNPALTIEEIALAVSDIALKRGKSVRAVFSFVDGEITNTALDSSRLCEQTNWQTRYAIKDSLDRIAGAITESTRGTRGCYD